MQSLISSIRKITINQCSVDDLVESLNNFSVLGKRKSELEYEELEQNYSKIVKIELFLNNLSEFEKSLLIKPLEQFLIILDKKTQYYLKEIDFNDYNEDILVSAQEISLIFYKSLATNNLFDKLKYIHQAYFKILQVLKIN
jgi:hypothetical protein